MNVLTTTGFRRLGPTCTSYRGGRKSSRYHPDLNPERVGTSKYQGRKDHDPSLLTLTDKRGVTTQRVLGETSTGTVPVTGVRVGLGEPHGLFDVQ